MLYDVEVFVATNNWWVERQSKGAHHYIIRIIPFLFDVLNSLYTETRSSRYVRKLAERIKNKSINIILLLLAFSYRHKTIQP